MFFLNLTIDAQHFLTFIMPCYNCSKTVIQSLDSIYAQNNLAIEFEVICTDDGSKDTTHSLLIEYQQTHPNMSVYFHDKNRGGAAARNTAVSHAKGDIIFCLDSDNVLVPDSVRGLIDLMDTTGCEAACFEKFYFFTGNFKLGDIWAFEAPNNICDIHHVFTHTRTPGASGNYLYTKKSYDRAGGYPVGNPADTWGFAFRQLATGTRIAILPNSFYWHRFSTNGYWMREYRAGRMRAAYLKVALEFPEIYSKKTWKYLNSRDKQNYYINDDIDNKITFELQPDYILQELFNASRYQAQGNYPAAVFEYRNIIELGYANAGIYEKLKSLHQKMNNSDR